MANFKRTVLRNRKNLIAGFERAIRISIHEAYIRSNGKPQEPDIVAMLMLEGVPHISNCLQKIGVKTTVSSLFCHQRPEVSYSDTSNKVKCELGDILIIHIHKDSNGIFRNNSLLLQAKMYSNSTHKIQSNELHQLKLYQEWPAFQYQRSGPLLNNLVRNVLPKLSHSGAQYLLVDTYGHIPRPFLNSPKRQRMAVWPAEDPLFADHSLSEALFNFICGFNGRIFTHNSKDDPTGWSDVVWDLLSHSVTTAFTRRNINVIKAPRSGGDSLLSSVTKGNFYSSKTNNIDDVKNYLREKLMSMEGDSDIPPNDENDDDPSGGVSLLLIETEDSE